MAISCAEYDDFIKLHEKEKRKKKYEPDVQAPMMTTFFP